jgi:ABC-type siderophore export system fused ATPase/permease subunit
MLTRFLGHPGIIIMLVITPIFILVSYTHNWFIGGIMWVACLIWWCISNHSEMLKRKEAYARKWEARRALTDLADYTHLYQNPDPRLQDIVRRISAVLD